MDNIVVPETFHQPIEDEAFEQIVSQKLEEAAAEENGLAVEDAFATEGQLRFRQLL